MGVEQYDADPNAHANTDADSYTDANANAHSNTYPNTDANTNTNRMRDLCGRHYLHARYGCCQCWRLLSL